MINVVVFKGYISGDELGVFIVNLIFIIVLIMFLFGFMILCGIVVGSMFNNIVIKIFMVSIVLVKFVISRIY